MDRSTVLYNIDETAGSLPDHAAETQQEKDQKQPRYFRIRPGPGGSRILDLFMTDMVDIYALYSQGNTLIHRMNENDTINLYIHTPGGVVDTAVMFNDSFRYTPATVIGHTGGYVMSAGTMLLAGCDRYDISADSVFMYHGYRSIMGGKATNMQSRVDAITAQMTNLIEIMVAYGFLNEEEFDRILNKGEDVYITGHQMIGRFQDAERDENGYFYPLATPVGGAE